MHNFALSRDGSTMAAKTKSAKTKSGKQKPDHASLLQTALDNPNVPKIYLNGFQIGSTNADVIILAQQNGRPNAVLNMSFEIAKTLVKKLGDVVEQVEEKTDTEFLTTEDF